VTFHFGTNRIPAKPRDIIENRDGVTMETGIGAPVKTIFEGEVSMVSNVGDQTLIVIKHGKYFTAYSNLGSASVSKGQKVTRGQVIGKAGINDDGVGEMELLITNEKGTYLNPESWIRR
jgi:murein hydrolase activator